MRISGVAQGLSAVYERFEVRAILMLELIGYLSNVERSWSERHA